MVETENKTQHTAIYCRVSTHRQDVARQISDCKSILTESQKEHVEIYVDEAQTGYDMDRPDFQKMVTKIKNNSISIIVTTEISRISRNASLFTSFLDTCMSNNTGLKTVQSDLPDIQPESPLSKLIGQIMAAVSEMEWEMTKDRIKSGVIEAKRQGKWVGRPPKGFETDGGYLQIKPDEFLRITSALELILNGHSIYEVAKRTNIPESTLRNIYNDEEKLQLYTELKSDNERISESLSNINNKPTKLNTIIQRIEKLEEKVD